MPINLHKQVVDGRHVHAATVGRFAEDEFIRRFANDQDSWIEPSPAAISEGGD